jgi:hypothetical protein
VISRIVAVLFVLMILSSLVDRASAFEPHARDGWMAGVSIGGATGEITFADASVGETEDGFSPQLRVGHMLGDHLALGVGYSGWMYETGVLPYKYRFSLQNMLLTATWFPGRPESGLGGFYVRLGAGLAWAAIAEVEILEDEEQGHGDRITDTGLGIEVNLGYEFRVARHAAVGAGLGVNHQNLDGDIYRDATFTPFTLNLAWYW